MGITTCKGDKLGGNIQTIILEQGNKKKIFKSRNEAAAFLKAAPNTVSYSAMVGKSLNGWKVTIKKELERSCLDCGGFVNRGDDYCTSCYYESLTGKSYQSTFKQDDDNAVPRVARI